MAELDVEKLKQSTKDIDNPTIGMDSHRSAVASFIAQRHAIIAALEDRDRLRLLGSYIVSTARLVPIEDDETAEAWVVHPQALAEFRAALEGHDG